MMNSDKMRERIANQPSYWVEQVNGILYNSIMDYMEINNMKRKDLAKHLGISRGRMSQIINEGDINFSLEKIIQIALKVNQIPSFTFENKEDFFKREMAANADISDLDPNYIGSEENYYKNSKVISLQEYSENRLELEAMCN